MKERRSSQLSSAAEDMETLTPPEAHDDALREAGAKAMAAEAERSMRAADLTICILILFGGDTMRYR